MVLVSSGDSSWFCYWVRLRKFI